MGLFGKQKTDEERLAEGRAYFECNDWRMMFFTLHGLAKKGNPEACYYIGRYWMNEKGGESAKRLAKKNLIIAAQANVLDAAEILAKEYGIREYLLMEEKVSQHAVQEAPEPVLEPVPEPEPVSEPVLEPVPEPVLEQVPASESNPENVSQTKPALTLEEAYNQGMDAYNAEDYVEAIRLWTIASDLGDEDAPFNLGVLYEDGKGVVADSAEAFEWYKLAANRGNATAQYNCGCLCLRGDGTEKDEVEARMWLKKAADQGDEDAEKLLKRLSDSAEKLYQAGLKAYEEEKYGDAIRLWRDAAEQGHPEAEQRAKELNDEMALTAAHVAVQSYNQGDYEEAVKYFRMAADWGNSDAMGMLGVLYESGRGVSKDRAESLKWYVKAAEHGNAVAQFRVGSFYFDNAGSTRDKQTAKKWIKAAADQGHEEAQEFLQKNF